MTARLSTGRFYGETLRRRRSDRFTVSEVRFPGGFRIPEHSHERPIVNFVLAGGYTEYWSGQRRECRSAETLFHPAGLVHSERFSGVGARCLAIEFDPDGLGLDPDATLPSGTAVFPPGRWAWISARLLKELRTADDLSLLVVEGLLLVLLSGVARRLRSGTAPEFVGRAHELLHDRFAEPIRIADIALEVGVHPSSLARAFQRHYRCTPGELVRGLRIELASRLLARPDLSLATIAREAGFSDQSHFSRTFKRATGMTPGAFRSLVSRN
ncbi:MAG TPA: helix-turn-helix domain-containing protein [Gemmatimonadota bacterium]|nr:helix-turn-helix domain-containing protein [Gemmatimonadota bacterium]